MQFTIKIQFKRVFFFFFRTCQEPVWRETTEGSSIEIIGYRLLPHERNGCTVVFMRHQSTKVYRAFSIFLLIVQISASNVGVTKNMQDLLRNWTPRENMLNIQKSQTHFRLSLSQECSGEISRKSLKSAQPINSLKVDVFPLKSNARFQLVKVRKQLARDYNLKIISPHETENQQSNKTSQRQ